MRISRPRGLSRADVQSVTAAAAGHLGRSYDARQIFDLTRFLFPWSVLPRRWRSSLRRALGGRTHMFAHNGTLKDVRGFGSSRRALGYLYVVT